MQQNEQSGAVRFDNFDVTFRTRGGLVFSKFSLEGKLLASIKSPNSLTAEPNLMNVSALEPLERLIVAAKAKLDAAK